MSIKNSSRNYKRDRAFFYFSVLFPVISYIIIFSYLFTNNDSSSLHSWVGIIFFALKFIWFASIILAITNIIGLLWYGSPLKLDDQNVKTFRRVGWNPGNRLIVAYVSRGDNHDALGRAIKETRRILEKYNVNYQIDIVTDIKVSNKIEQYLKSKFYVVPQTYYTKRYARYKARALHYLLERRSNHRPDITPKSTWVLHLDEESVITEPCLAGIAKFITNPQHTTTVGQGEIKYNAYNYGKSFLITVVDNVRTGDDLGRFRFQYKMLNKPVFGMHGSYVLVPEKIERTVGFDLGGRGSITEDAYFALHAMEQGYRFDWVEGYIREQSPFTLGAILKQRRRWYCGLMYLSFDRQLKLRTRFFLLINMLLWTIGWLGPLITIANLLYPNGYAPIEITLTAAFIQGSYGAVYMVGAYRGMIGIRIRPRKKVLLYFGTFILQPITNLVEGLAILYGIIRPVKSFDVVKK